MAKIAKAAAKTAAQKTDKDLFSDLGAAPRRIAGKATRAAKPTSGAEARYTARDIEVLEGLEPVRRRPGMYIGGTDEKALHHLFAEVIDNSMDEALEGHASFIDVEMEADGFVAVTDNGRGIPVDPHPKFKNKSALEVIMCTLHAGGKFDSKVYGTSGGLHGVGVSVANALSERMEVEVAREQTLYRMVFERGKPKGKLEKVGRAPNRRGTKVRFRPDPDIFGAKAHFRPQRIFKMARSKAYPRRADSSRHLCRQCGQGRRPRRGAVGGCLDRGQRRLSLLLLQHDPHPGRRHARVGAAQRAAQRHQGSRRAHGPGQARGIGDRRRRDDRRRVHGLGVHSRAGVPGPDQ